MKKLCAFVFMILAFSFSFYAYAADNILFGLEFSGEELQLNRGFNIYFNAKSAVSTNISSLRLDISYDSTQLKFLSAESTADIDYLENESGTVRIVWLNLDGQNISAQPEQLFTIRFKPTISPKNTSYTFSTKIYEAGTSNAEYLTVENSPSIIVTSNTSVNTYNALTSKSEKSQTESSKSKNDSESENRLNSEMQSTSEESTENSSAETDSDTDISIGERKTITSENGFTYFIFGAGGMLALIAIIFLAYNIGKKHSSNKP